MFNAHWLTYFDETCTRFVESWGFGSDYWVNEFDVMLVKAVLEWSGPARFDDWIDITAEPARIGTKSFDVRYRAAVAGRPACEAVITYVAIEPGTNDSIVLPDEVRAALGSASTRPDQLIVPATHTAFAVTGEPSESTVMFQPVPVTFGRELVIARAEPVKPPPVTTSPTAQEAVIVASTEVGADVTM